MKKRWSYHILTALSLSCCLSSCCLVYDYPEACGDIKVTIVNDWSKAPDANPEGMAYIFFNDYDRQSWRFDFPGSDAGKVMLSDGHYHFVSFNDDTYHTVIEGDSYSSMKAYTLPSKLPHDIDNGQPVVESPDIVWGYSRRVVEISYKSGKDFLTAYQRQLTPRYRLIIEEVKNLAGVRSMSAALSGMARSYHFDTGQPDIHPVTMSFEADAIDDTTIGSEFCTFGLTNTSDIQNILYLFVTLNDGCTFEYSFNVTSQVHEAPDPMSVLIMLRGLVIEKSGSGAQGGFDVAVDGWTIVDVNITD